jgi:hypothetical protein
MSASSCRYVLGSREDGREISIHTGLVSYLLEDVFEPNAVRMKLVEV